MRKHRGEPRHRGVDEHIRADHVRVGELANVREALIGGVHLVSDEFARLLSFAIVRRRGQGPDRRGDHLVEFVALESRAVVPERKPPRLSQSLHRVGEAHLACLPLARRPIELGEHGDMPVRDNTRSGLLVVLGEIALDGSCCATGEQSRLPLERGDFLF